MLKLPARWSAVIRCFSNDLHSGLVHVFSGFLVFWMGKPHVRGEHLRHFRKHIWIWAKFRFAKGAFVIARKSPLAVFGCD